MYESAMLYVPLAGVDPGFLLGRGAQLRNEAADW